MYPKEHIIWGGVFSLIVKLLFPSIGWMFIGLMFLATFLIDFDHYLLVVYRTHKFGLGNALRWFDDYIRRERKAGRIGLKAKKGLFVVFHTVEFHALVLLLGYFWIGFFYIFIGMVFHSILDCIRMHREDELHTRWFSLTEWFFRRDKK